MIQQTQKKAETPQAGGLRLGEVVRGIDGRELEIGPGQKLTVRRAILHSLTAGIDVKASQGQPLPPDKRVHCYLLAREIADADDFGYMLRTEDASLIKELASYVLRQEGYGAFVLHIDPAEAKK